MSDKKKRYIGESVKRKNKNTSRKDIIETLKGAQTPIPDPRMAVTMTSGVSDALKAIQSPMLDMSNAVTITSGVSDALKAMRSPILDVSNAVTVTSGVTDALKAIRNPMFDMNEALKVTSPLSETLKAIQTPKFDMTEALRVTSSVSETLKAIQAYPLIINDALRSIEVPHQTMLESMSKAAEIVANAKQFNMVANSPFLRDEFFRHVDRLPTSYQVSTKYIEEAEDITDTSNAEQLVIEDTLTDTSIPLDDLPATFGVIDLLESITEEEVISFYQHLSQYPMLGMLHPVGQKILDGVSQMQRTTLETLPVTLYRVRQRAENQMMPFTIQEMWEAPFGISGNGRWNYTGYGVLYTCDSLEGAKQEIKVGSEVIVDAMILSLKEPIDFVDLVEKECPLFNFCQYPSYNSYKSNLSYLVPNFLAQCCQRVGIQAIRYKSSVYDTGINYVFFQHSRGWFDEPGFQYGINVRPD